MTWRRRTPIDTKGGFQTFAGGAFYGEHGQSGHSDASKDRHTSEWGNTAVPQ